MPEQPSLLTFRPENCPRCGKLPEVGGTCDGCGTKWVPDRLGTLQRVTCEFDGWIRNHAGVRVCVDCGAEEPAHRDTCETGARLPDLIAEGVAKMPLAELRQGAAQMYAAAMRVAA